MTRKTEGRKRPDLPRIVATAVTYGTTSGIRVGVNYLRLKGKARKASMTFVRELERGGVPPDLARRLGDEYGAEISVRRIMDLTGGGLFRGLSER